jgi:uncharacterized repeat protein (TIGR03809 family)
MSRPIDSSLLRQRPFFLLTGWFMTYRFDVAYSRDIVARWCALAEQRLEYLTELFETGRWRRYHTELAFLENIQEAKTAVVMWRALLTREASPDNAAVDMSWLDRSRAALPRVDMPGGQVHRFVPQPVPIAAEPPSHHGLVAAEPDQVYSDDAPSVPEPDPPAIDAALDPTLDSTLDPVLDRLTRDIAAITERYPLLRNVM